MHELSVALQIVDSVTDAVLPRGGASVRAVSVAVGSMSGVVPEALRFAWTAASDGTVLDGTELQIQWVPAAVHCPRCDAERELPGPRLRCPVCDTPTPRVVRGRELDLLSVELHDEQPVR